jgi:tRNA dimethylallyltransferase
MKGEKIIIIVGPTASGKSELAVKTAKSARGEIISADSRQIYKGLNIGSGKVPGRWRQGRYFYKGIAHHLLDIADPKKQVSAAQFQKLANRAIKDIIARGKIPIICGGTAHWIDAVVFAQKFPSVKPDLKLRAQLEKQSIAQLFVRLKKLDPARAKNIDSRNPRRLVRALEIVLTTGQAVPALEQTAKFDALWLGLKLDQEILYKKIDKRMRAWFKQGLLEEIGALHEQSLSWQRLESFGLEYKFGALYLQGKITREEMLVQTSSAIKHYAKRQMTWWKRNTAIKWLEPNRVLAAVKKKYPLNLKSK